MHISRQWVTPITAGAFLLLAVTGVLMFFHADTGLNKLAHEWLGWVLLAGAALHVTAHFKAMANHLRSRRGQLLVGGFVLALLASFVPAGGGADGPPFRVPVEALARSPVGTLAAVARVSPDEMRRRLEAAGLSFASPDQSVADVVGPDLRRQLGVLSSVLAGDPR